MKTRKRSSYFTLHGATKHTRHPRDLQLPELELMRNCYVSPLDGSVRLRPDVAVRNWICPCDPCSFTYLGSPGCTYNSIHRGESGYVIITYFRPIFAPFFPPGHYQKIGEVYLTSITNPRLGTGQVAFYGTPETSEDQPENPVCGTMVGAYSILADRTDRRKIHFSAPGLPRDFRLTTVGGFRSGAGWIELRGHGDILDMRTVGDNVLLWDAGGEVTTLLQTGNKATPFKPQKLAELAKLRSNPHVFHDSAYFVTDDGFMYRANGHGVQRIPGSFRLAALDTQRSADVNLVWAEEFKKLAVHVRGSGTVHLVDPVDGRYCEFTFSMTPQTIYGLPYLALDIPDLVVSPAIESISGIDYGGTSWFADMITGETPFVGEDAAMVVTGVRVRTQAEDADSASVAVGIRDVCADEFFHVGDPEKVTLVANSYDVSRARNFGVGDDEQVAFAAVIPLNAGVDAVVLTGIEELCTGDGVETDFIVTNWPGTLRNKLDESFDGAEVYGWEHAEIAEGDDVTKEFEVDVDYEEGMKLYVDGVLLTEVEAFPGAGGNLLTVDQPSCEAGITGWSATAGTLSHDTTVAWQGSGSLKVVNGTGSSINPTIRVTDDDQYFVDVTGLVEDNVVFSVYLKSEFAEYPPDAKLEIWFEDSGGSPLGSVEGDSYVDLTSEWQRFELTTEVPVGAVSGLFSAKCRSLEPGDTIWGDGAQYEQGEVATEWSAPEG